MYADAVVAARQQVLEDQYKEALPGGKLERVPVTHCHAMAKHLEGVWDPDKGEPRRAFSRDEELFILNEQLLCKIDYAYAAERYIWINYEGQALRPMYPLWESQRLILWAVAREEERRWRQGHPDGLLFNVLKGRQLGASTLVQSLLAHRCLTHAQVRTLIASDVPENSGSEGLFGMLELVVKQWPWWLKPKEQFHTKNKHIMWENGSRVLVGSGKSMTGGLQDQGAVKGQLGRSKTFSAAHLSEIATWERPEQINNSLLPAIPRTPRTLAARESTAQGRNNYWHQEWNLAAKGEDPRFFNVFVPWYAEKTKYWLPSPEGWIPSGESLAFAARAERTGPQYMHRPVSLTKEQLYWYEVHYRAAQSRERLYEFLSEYPAEPEEAFQNSGRSIFSVETLSRVANQARPLCDLLTIKPRAELLEEKDRMQAEWQESQRQLQEAKAAAQRRQQELVTTEVA